MKRSRSGSVRSEMTLVSLNVGLPKNVTWRGKEIFTGIFKSPVEAPLRVGTNGFERDAVGDARVHGGEHKAVYAYPQENYPYFEELLRRDDFLSGQFGENLTTAGLLESEVQIGDRYRIGSALFEVSQPREPCFKLGMRMNDSGFAKAFLKSLRTGFYLRVTEHGTVEAGQEIELVDRTKESLTVSDVVRARYFDRENVALLRVAASLAALSPAWREEFSERLGELSE